MERTGIVIKLTKKAQKRYSKAMAIVNKFLYERFIRIA